MFCPSHHIEAWFPRCKRYLFRKLDKQVAKTKTESATTHGKMVTKTDSAATHRQANIKTDNDTTRGQMTIEFAVLFPVMLMIALIACNSILFLSECSAFDRMVRESVCVFAPSPASDESSAQICALVEGSLESFSQKDYLSCTVSASAHDNGLTTYTATLFFTPTIFGAYPLRSVFDVELTPIEHPIAITVDSYKPGVFL